MCQNASMVQGCRPGRISYRPALYTESYRDECNRFFTLFKFEIDHQYFHDSGNRQADKQCPIDPDYESIAIYIPKEIYRIDISIFRLLFLLHYLEDKELQVITLICRPQDRMIRSLGTELYLAETLMGCLGSFFDGLCQQFLGHEMRAGAGGEIAAIFDKLQAFHIDLTITFDGVFGCLTGFCECRWI